MGTHVRDRRRHVREFIMIERFALRERMEAAVESMLALLDELEGDTDREPDFGDWEPDNDDEPWLGWSQNGGGSPNYDAGEDREYDVGDDLQGPDVDREYTALEHHGMGFVRSGRDDAEEDDDGGSDVNDEPHDDINTFDGILADQDAAALLHEELWFQNAMDATRAERLKAHDETLGQIAKVIKRTPASHWSTADPL
ncbi:hypothetical protein EJV44_08935 [Ancylobacter aquaticus]|nr:hypothetical protein EJV44_08935 [Ancylobacter aquaticus]